MAEVVRIGQSPRSSAQPWNQIPMVMRRHSARSRRSRHSEAAQLSDLASINTVTRDSGSASSYVDVIDRVLDKGIVIEAWIRLSVGGIDLITIEAHVIVASIDTYLEYWPKLDGAAAMANQSLTARSEHSGNTEPVMPPRGRAAH